jgi:hypothetical protein
MEPIIDKSLFHRLRNFTVILGGVLLFVYVFLPFLTDSFSILSSMSAYLDESGIDPTRYYYTDVEQVKEAEQYLDSVLNTQYARGDRPLP